jgi:hypothetical protein
MNAACKNCRSVEPVWGYIAIGNDEVRNWADGHGTTLEACQKAQ